MAKIIHRNEQRVKKKEQNITLKSIFKFMNNSVFEKTMENIIKLVTKKKLFGIRTKLSEQTVFRRKSVGNRNTKNTDVYE